MERDVSGCIKHIEVIQGIPYMAKFFGKDIEKRLQTIKTVELRSDDIFLCTYPKSGTHWVYEMLNMLVQGHSQYTKHWLSSNQLEESPVDVFSKFPSPRIFSTHLSLQCLPDQLFGKKVRIVRVERNPKSVCVSYLNYLNFHNLLSEEVDWPRYLTMFVDGKVPFGSWFDYVRKWQIFTKDHPDIPIHVTCYEAMMKDPLQETRKLAKFLGLDLSESVLKEIVEACSFDKLKEAHSKKDTTFERVKDAASHYFWKGTTSEWKNWFTVAQSEYFDKVCQEKGVTSKYD